MKLYTFTVEMIMGAALVAAVVASSETEAVALLFGRNKSEVEHIVPVRNGVEDRNRYTTRVIANGNCYTVRAFDMERAGVVLNAIR
jgi:hypothetical protein